MTDDDACPAAPARSPDLDSVQRRTVRSLVTVQVVGAFGLGAAPSVGILLAETVTHSEVLAGVARSGLTLGTAIAAVPLASLAARRGRRAALTLGWAIATVGSALLVASAYAVSTALLVLGMILFGIGTAASFQARFAAVDLERSEHRARTMALVGWIGTFGAVIAPNMGIPGRWVEERLGMPLFSGAFALAMVLPLLTSILMWALLRPDPLLYAQQQSPAPPPPPAGRRGGAYRRAWRTVRAYPGATTAFVSMIFAHTSMVSVMTMTPVALHHHGDSIELIGLTISLHVAGMFLFAPLFGRLVDSHGESATILLGVAIFLASAAAGFAAPATWATVTCLILLGLGWSAVTVAGAAMLTGSVPESERPEVQGLGDGAMNLAAAAGALASGPLMAWMGFTAFAGSAGVLMAPVIAVVLWYRGRRAA